VNREPATLQAVVLRAAPTDLSVLSAPEVVSSMERLPGHTPDDRLVYSAASPIMHVSKSSPPALLIHGDSDDIVPYQQSVAMETALHAAGVPVKLVTIPGGEHGPNFGSPGKPHPQLPLAFKEMLSWLDKYLRTPSAQPTR